jgi:hypothetical protein
MGKPEGKRPLGTSKLMLEDNNKMDLIEIEWVAWIELIWLKVGSGRRLL